MNNLKTVIHKPSAPGNIFSNHGGTRPGSGRKKSDKFWKGEVISVRLNEALRNQLEFESIRTGKSKSKLIQEAIYRLYHPMGDIIDI